MSEYKVTFKATIPGLFSDKTATEVKIYEGATGEEAISKAKAHLKEELSREGIDPEDDGFSVEITDIQRL